MLLDLRPQVKRQIGEANRIPEVNFPQVRSIRKVGEACLKQERKLLKAQTVMSPD